METVKDILSFCNAVVFYDLEKSGITEESNQASKHVINSFYETMSLDRVLITLSIIDVVILKIIDNQIKNFIEKNS